MQNAKDTFYMTLRDRLAAHNPLRTCVVRGATRPGVVVEENELASGETMPGVFRLRWTERTSGLAQTLPLDTAQCEIRYTPEDSGSSFALDAGRAMDAMDGDLDAILQPGTALKKRFSPAGSSTMQTVVFWREVKPRVLEKKSGARVAVIAVCAYREAGE